MGANAYVPDIKKIRCCAFMECLERKFLVVFFDCQKLGIIDFTNFGKANDNALLGCKNLKIM